MGLLDSLRPQQTGSARAMALTVKAKAIDPKFPMNSRFDVVDEAGNEYQLMARPSKGQDLPRTPLAEVKVSVGGIVIAEGAYIDDKIEGPKPTLSSRYITAAAPTADSGFTLTSVARVVMYKRQDGEHSVKAEVLDAPYEVNNLEEAQAAIVAAIDGNRDKHGWPSVFLQVTATAPEAEGKPAMHSSAYRYHHVATAGAAGSKVVAPNDAQARHATDDKTSTWLTEAFRVKAENPELNVSVSVVPSMTFSLGLDSANVALMDPVFQNRLGNGAGDPNNSFTRHHPRVNVKHDADQPAVTEMAWSPMILSLRYAKDRNTDQYDQNRIMVTKMTPLMGDGPEVPLVTTADLSRLGEALGLTTAQPPLSNASQAQDPTDTGDLDEADDINLDELDQAVAGVTEESKEAAAGGPGF